MNPNAPPWPAFRGYHTYSFGEFSAIQGIAEESARADFRSSRFFLVLANKVMGERLPTILSKGIEDVYKTLNQEVSLCSSCGRLR